MSGKDSPPVAILSVLRLVVELKVDKHRSLNKHAYACDEISRPSADHAVCSHTTSLWP